MRKREGKELHIACVQRTSGGEYRISPGENIWGGNDPDALSGGIYFLSLGNLIKAGWEID
jgi:hypothetical protein